MSQFLRGVSVAALLVALAAGLGSLTGCGGGTTTSEKMKDDKMKDNKMKDDKMKDDKMKDDKMKDDKMK
jgi:hypothetical protein